MSRTPANYSMVLVRGTTWEDQFEYIDDTGAPADLTGWHARMHVRTMETRFGKDTDGLVLQIGTDGADPLMVWTDAAAGKLKIFAHPEQHAALNPDNMKKAKYAYSIELYRQVGTYEDVKPLVTGALNVLGEVTR